MPQLEASTEIDFYSADYQDAYSRINAIVIEGEQEAFENYQSLGEMLPESKERLLGLSKMESRHRKGFEACGRNVSFCCKNCRAYRLARTYRKACTSPVGRQLPQGSCQLQGRALRISRPAYKERFL